MIKRYALTALLILSATVILAAADPMNAFPPAEEGMERHVVQLTEQEDESRLKVQLIVGQTCRMDRENRYFFSGWIEEETIPGWGYTRYLVRSLGQMGGTLIAADRSLPLVERFISLGGGPYLIPYNSRFPVVVYAPEGTEVRYRIWGPQPEIKVMGKG